MQSRPPVPTEPIGRFRLVAEIGRGGMGVVYRAIDTASGTEVALKVLLSGQHGNQESIARFLREAEAAAALAHPHLVPVREQGWDGTKPFLVMDLIEGPSLEDVLLDGPIDPRRAAALASGLARGLHCAHRSGLVHRDVKPGNVLLQGEQARLTDFGLAIESDAERLTRTGQVLGTPTYMAPEQATSQRDVPGELSDQYSLGAVLYEMLTGSPPYEGGTAAQVLVTLVGQPPRPLRSLAPAIPLDLVTVVETAMARDPEHRYPDCAALADDLDRFLRGQHVVAKPRPLWERGLEHIVRHRVAWTAVILSAGVLLGGGLGYAVVTDVRSSRVEAARQAEADASYHGLRSQLPSLPRAERHERLAAWLAVDAHRGTRAASLARLDEADRMLDERAPAAASWYGEAFAAASDPELQHRALLGVVDAFEWSWRFDDLAVVTELLHDTVPAAERATAAARLAAARGDLAAASGLLTDTHPAAGGLLSALASARPSVPVPVGARAVDWDADPSDGLEIGGLVDGRLRVVRLSRGGPVVDRIVEVPPGLGSAQLLATRPPTVLAHREGEGHGELLLLDDDGHPLLTTVDAAPLDAVATDLDGDGVREIYAGIGPYARHLLRILPDDAGWRAAEGPQQLVDIASDVTAVMPRHPADAPPELWVASGAWRAYDLRTFRADATGELVQTRRHKHGYVSQIVAVDDRIALVDSDLYPSRVGFEEGREYGEERGIWLLDPLHDTRQHLRVPGPPRAELGPLQVGDFDGDGDTDLALGLRSANDRVMALWARDGEGYDGPWLVRGLLPAATAQLDDDPADELVVQRDDAGESWVLGDGDAALPIVERREARTRHPLPSGVRPTHAARWSRAESLAAMGLSAEAAELLAEVAASLPEAAIEVRSAALARAGQLQRSAGDPVRAAALLEEAAGGDASHRAEAQQAALDAHLLPAAIALGAAPPSWAADDRPVNLLAEDMLQIVDPLGIRRRDTGTRVTAVSGGPPIATQRLAWAGHHLSLTLDMTVDHVEWGAGIEVRLTPVEGDPVSVGVRGWGGGNHLERELGCLHPVGPHPHHAVKGASVEEAWQLRLDWREGQLFCAVEGADGSSTTSVQPWLLSPGDLLVEVRPAQHAGVDAFTVASATVHRLLLEGTGMAPLPPTATADDARTALWRAAETGDAEPAALARLARQHPAELPRLIRLRTPTFTPALVQAIGRDALLPFARAFDTAYHNHPDDPAPLRAHTAAAGSVLDLDLSGASFAERVAAARIRARRGAAWRRMGEPDAAQVDLRDAAGEAGELAAERDDPQVHALGFLVHAELASLAAEAGAERVARAEVARAVDWHTSPDIARDVLASRPELQPLVAP